LKLGKTAWVFLAIGFFVVVGAGLIMAYYENEQEQIRLQQELSLTQETLTKYSPKELSSRQEEVENRLAGAESELEAAKANLRQSIESIEVTDTIFDAAATSNVKILRIRSLGTPIDTVVQELTLTVLSLSVKVEGDISDLVNFVVELNGKFPSGAIESVEIIVPVAVEGEEEEEELTPSADILLSIHTYEDD